MQGYTYVQKCRNLYHRVGLTPLELKPRTPILKVLQKNYCPKDHYNSKSVPDMQIDSTQVQKILSIEFANRSFVLTLAVEKSRQTTFYLRPLCKRKQLAGTKQQEMYHVLKDKTGN